jgi:uncharacterized protein YndB with AHSA1/START domain
MKVGMALAVPVVLSVGYLIGLFLPAVYAARIELVVPNSADQVWTVLTDLDAMPSWRADLVSLERLPGGRGTVRWREVPASGSARALERLEGGADRIVVRTADSQPPRRWVYQIRRTSGGSLVAVTAERTLGNPLARSAVRLFGSDERELEQLGRDLGSRLAGRRQLIAEAGGR